jgi:hypothetical protein
MYPIVETTTIKAYSPMTGRNENFIKNVVINKEGKRMVWHGGAHYYLNNDNTISRRMVKSGL